MTQKTIGIGTLPNDGTGDSIRASFQKVNDNFDELYAGGGDDPDTMEVTATGSSTPRTLADWMADAPPSFASFGGSPSASAADNTTALTAAEASDRPVYVPFGDYDTTRTNYRFVAGQFYGEGRLKDNSGNYLPPYYAAVLEEPTRGSEASLLTAYNGDLVGSPFKRGLYIAGSDTMGDPTSGYQITPETAVTYDWIRYESGHMESKTNGDGRTGYIAHRTVIDHRGAGDTMVFSPSVIVHGDGDETVTNILSQPAGTIYSGAVTAYADNVGVTYGEVTLNSNGFDVRGVGPNLVLSRDDDTGSNYQWWEGFRMNSNGAVAVDCGLNLISPGLQGSKTTGGYVVGIGLAGARITGAAIAMAVDQTIEFHAENPIGESTGGINRFPETRNGWTQGYTAVSGSIPAGIRFATPASRKMIIADDHVRIGSGSDSAFIFRVYGASTSMFLSAGLVGTKTILGAATTAAEATELALRAATAAGTETTLIQLNGNDLSLTPGANGTQSFGTASFWWNRVFTNALIVADGITAPSATAGQTKIYVDTADGALKVKFGDGFTDTLSAGA